MVVNMEDLKEFNQPPQILDDYSFEDPASAVIQDICAGPGSAIDGVKSV